MKCQRCGEDTSVRRHEIDGFDGWLCEECLEKWQDVASYLALLLGFNRLSTRHLQ